MSGEKGFSKQFWIGESKAGSLLETQALLTSENFDSLYRNLYGLGRQENLYGFLEIAIEFNWESNYF